MNSGARTGALAGSAAGLVVGVMIAVLGYFVFADLNGSGRGNDDGSIFVLVILVLVSIGVGAGVGAVAAAVAVSTARSAQGDAATRRLKGALASAAVATAPVVLLGTLTAFVILFIPAVLCAALGGVGAWIALPRLVDLETPAVAQQLPAQYGEQPAAAPRGWSTGTRWLVTAAAAGLGGFVVTHLVMGFAGFALSRDARDAVAIAVLGVSAVVIGTVVWRRTSPPTD